MKNPAIFWIHFFDGDPSFPVESTEELDRICAHLDSQGVRYEVGGPF